MKPYLTIGKVARQAGVSIQTVLYYERRHLLNPDERTDSGYRLFTPEAVRVIRFIKNAQNLGFSLKEICKLLHLRASNKDQCDNVKRHALAKLKMVQEKISALHAMENVLRRLIRRCSARATTGRCPIMESLRERRNSL